MQGPAINCECARHWNRSLLNAPGGVHAVVTVPAVQFRARYRAVKFPAGTPTSPGTLTFTPDDLAHALFVTGRAPGDRAAYGSASFWELLHRTSLIPAYVRGSSGGRRVRSRLALELDRSEMVALSHALGQAMTGIHCEKLFSVTHQRAIRRGDRSGPGAHGRRPEHDCCVRAQRAYRRTRQWRSHQPQIEKGRSRMGQRSRQIGAKHLRSPTARWRIDDLRGVGVRPRGRPPPTVPR